MSAAPGEHDVVLRVGGSPENVRTARLVAAAVARREGLPEDRVDEVRIAVGEAVTWAMQTDPGNVVELMLGPGETGAEEFVVRVQGGLPAVDPASDGHADAAAEGLARALLRGLADQVVVSGDTTTLTWGDVPAT